MFHHIETSQLICRANQLTGFYMMRTFVVKGLRLSLKETQYLQIESIEKGTHTNENMMLKLFYLYGFVR